jgi:hypothetical protein
MANNKNNNKKSVELLPEELRQKEEKKKEEKKPEITFYVPSEEEKPKIVKISFFEKIFGTKEERQKKKLARQKEKEEKRKKEAEEKAKLKALKVQKEAAERAEKEAKEKEKIEAKKMQKPEVAPPKIMEEKKKDRPWEPKIKKEILPKPLRPSLGVTLMPEKVAPKELPAKKEWVIVLVFALLACLLGFALYLIMFFYQSNVKDQTKIVLQNIESLKKETAPFEKDKTDAQKIQGQLEAIKNLLAAHLYWTKIFDLLEKNTVPDVYYTNFVAGSDGKIALSAVGKSFSSVAEQLTVFREAKDFVKEVSITGASAQIDPTGEIQEVNFEISLKLIPEVFLK